MGTIKHMLQRLVGTHLESWPRMLPLARGAYMRHVHSATRVSPMEMACKDVLVLVRDGE